ncbi:MAG: diaminopimelate decarboxylase [Muribaculaceae bacterium]|nr:diaminopimelate decarboxylase [Muribaculaceae bacterium]
MFMNFPLDKFKQIPTPFYYYDMDLLQDTLDEIKRCIAGFPFKVHYAVKANANATILEQIRRAGLGIDCVSGGELAAAISAGFAGNEIAFAGVGKTDKEIAAGIDSDIFCFNVESLPEMEVINEIAASKGKVARIAIRVNPNIDAHTHKYITTGLNENKFGINVPQLDDVVDAALAMQNVELIGLHFHIGSQIRETEPFIMLCEKANELLQHLEARGVKLSIINVGGGLGINYDDPDGDAIAGFDQYFSIFKQHLKLREGQELHFELGRAVVAQCGSLITRVTYVKTGIVKKFIIVDAGMSDLIRPALYQAHHKIENISATGTPTETYDVVGPICESSDCFGTDETLPITHRGDFIALRSAGAYGEIMASRYNCREFPAAIYSE